MIVRTLALLALVGLPATASAGKRTSAKKLDIASLAIETPAGGVCAGQASDLVVAATLADGSTLRTPDALRPRDFKISADLGEVTGKDELFVENTGLELAGRSVTVTVAGKSGGATGQTTLPLGFGCAIALDYTGDGAPGSTWIPPRAERDMAEIEAYQAETGKTGPRLKDIARAALPIGYAVDNLTNAQPALAGDAGADGADGGPGGNGAVGGVGGPGQAGASGHSLVVDVGLASGAAEGLVLVAITPTDGAAPRSVLIDAAAGGRLTLVTRGGVGGRGGKGGTGGNGGQGIWDYNQGRGGDGAAGGNGGPGGPGGRGGDVQVRYDSAQPGLAQVVAVDAAGGAGGRGGDGGSFGSSGPGAEGGGDSGSMGSTESASGPYGPDGAPGTVTTVPVQSETLFANLEG